MQRRAINAALAAAGLSHSSGEPTKDEVVKPQALQLSKNGWMPNNEHLPVLLYRHAIRLEGEDPAAAFEKRFESFGWPAQWRDGVYDFHHYHSTAHEVLGFAGGRARLMLGGEKGKEVEVAAGDVLVLPTGTGHCKLHASSDFLVVGAYPLNQHWDICRSAPTTEAAARMRTLPFPKSDPLFGDRGPLTTLWRTV